MSTALQVFLDSLGVLGVLLAVAVAICARAMTTATYGLRRIPVDTAGTTRLAEPGIPDTRRRPG